MTPNWVLLVVAAIGLAGTVGGALGGVLITGRMTEQRERAAWERERKKLNYERRADLYIRLADAIDVVAFDVSFASLTVAWPDDQKRDTRARSFINTLAEHSLALMKFDREIALFASASVREHLKEVSSAARAFGVEVERDPSQDPVQARNKVRAAVDELHAAMRQDLGIEDFNPLNNPHYAVS
jgi:hypothetical protein